jgi:hypothetical protein
MVRRSSNGASSKHFIALPFSDSSGCPITSLAFFSRLWRKKILTGVTSDCQLAAESRRGSVFGQCPARGGDNGSTVDTSNCPLWMARRSVASA